MRSLPSIALLALAACAFRCNHSPPEPSNGPVDSGPGAVTDSAPPPVEYDAGEDADADAGTVADDAGCFLNPTTYFEIINACTDAQAIDKSVDLSPMNLPDGGLQPLP